MNNKLIQDAIAEFPLYFGLRALPGDVFRISPYHSYMNDHGTIMLYTEIRRNGQWCSFAKGSQRELRAEIVTLANPEAALAAKDGK